MSRFSSLLPTSATFIFSIFFTFTFSAIYFLLPYFLTSFLFFSFNRNVFFFHSPTYLITAMEISEDDSVLSFNPSVSEIVCNEVSVHPPDPYQSTTRGCSSVLTRSKVPTFHYVTLRCHSKNLSKSMHNQGYHYSIEMVIIPFRPIST